MVYHWWLENSIVENFCYMYNVFSEEEIEKIIEIGNNPEFSTPDTPRVGTGEAEGEGHNIDSKIRECNLSWIRSDISEIYWIFEKIVDHVHMANNRFFKYDLDYVQNLQFTKYNLGDFYASHIDMSYKSPRARKLSFTIQLDDEESYEGGDVLLYSSSKPHLVARKKGAMTVFPSYTLHEVKPVTKGVRHALVGWICGPNFK